ncbi:MAG TPA: hypothetical protein VK841_08140 [Polyangiaceae bacterium]|jgi:tetratricopeptide (TPR) repeat protein|nr:hypothetical protein [Polyangiaceae bacterium]
MASAAALLVAAAVLGATGLARAAVARESIDEEDFLRMKAQAPHAAELLERGEALAVRGEVAEAESLFRQARQEYSDGPLLLRRECQALTVLGRRAEAVGACLHSISDSHTNATLRATVRALVDGPSPPTAADLSEALLFVAKERDRTFNGNPVPIGAECDIAESIGDGVMLEHCAKELVEYAPGAEDTRRALEVLALRCPPWRFWTGWLALLGLVAFTAGHALRRFRRRVAPAAALVCVLVTVFAKTAAADPDNAEPGYLSRWRVDDNAPETKIPPDSERNADPLEFGYWLQDVALKAERASHRGDHPTAARFYKTLAIAVPDRAVGFTKMCSEYEAMGDHDQAIAACGAALLRDGLVVQDYLNYVQLVTAKPGRLSDAQVKTLDEVVKQMRQDPASEGAADGVQCSIATRTSNVQKLDECTRALAQKAPDDPQTISYQWALAMERGHFDEARALVARGRTLGLEEAPTARMQKAIDDGVAQRNERILMTVLAVALLAAAAGTLIARMRRRVVAPSPA